MNVWEKIEWRPMEKIEKDFKQFPFIENVGVEELVN